MKKSRAFPATAIILAGGESRRMTAPKALLKVGGLSIIERELRALRPLFEEVLIVANDPGLFGSLGCRVVPDTSKFQGARGPMLGVYSGLSGASKEYGFVVACDMPFIEPKLVGWMAGLTGDYDLIAPRVGEYVEPLFGFYRKTALGVLEAALGKGVRRLQDVFGELKVRYVDETMMRPFDPGLRSFINVNTPADLVRAEAITAMNSRAGQTREEEKCLVEE